MGIYREVRWDCMNKLDQARIVTSIFILNLVLTVFVQAKIDPEHDIRKFSTHFQPGKSLEMWDFPPPDIHMVSTDVFPGLLTIRHSGADVEFKGTFKEPLALADYPPPWDFEIDVIHSYWTKALGG
jgi:hypothetical protein